MADEWIRNFCGNQLPDFMVTFYAGSPPHFSEAFARFLHLSEYDVFLHFFAYFGIKTPWGMGLFAEKVPKSN